MIRLLRGVVAGKGRDHLIVEVGGALGGIGLKVFTTEPTLHSLALDASVLLHSWLQVREDALTLFGFEAEEELEMFELLLSVSGVGPKVALSALSVMSPDGLRLALANEEPALISRVPGIGKRTAEKIVMELKHKMKPTAGSVAGLVQIGHNDVEVVEALIALGYSVVESQRAVQGLPKDVTGTEDRLRLALSRFAS